MPVPYTKDFLKDGIEKFGWEIGDYSYGSMAVHRWENSDGKLIIGRFCSIATGVAIFLGGDHRHDWVTTYPFSVISDTWPTGSNIPGHPASKGNVVIGNDVWVGAHATIMSGVTIGSGSVVANHAVVMADIPDYGIAIGNPARTLKKRFSAITIERLLRLKWWDWPNDKIAQALPLMCSTDIELFLNTYENQ